MHGRDATGTGIAVGTRRVWVTTQEHLDGSSVAVCCTASCADAWCDEMRNRAIIVDDPKPFDASGDPPAWCTHCAFCGALIAAPASCRAHGDECSELEWLLSCRGQRVVLAIQVHLEPGEVVTDRHVIVAEGRDDGAISPARLAALAITAVQAMRDYESRNGGGFGEELDRD